MSLSCRIVAVCGLLFLAAWAPLAGQEKKKPLPKAVPFPEGITWQLAALNKEPLKVVSTRHLPKEGAVYWVFELTRDFTVYEDQGYWAPAFKLGKHPRFRFELLDEDGIILRTAEAHYIGEYVSKAGKRFAVYFALPPELASEVKTVIAIQP
jgi:hypothetical protein